MLVRVLGYETYLSETIHKWPKNSYLLLSYVYFDSDSPKMLNL